MTKSLTSTFVTGLVGVCLLAGACATEAFGQQGNRKQGSNQARAIVRALARLSASGGAGLLKKDATNEDMPRALNRWLSAHQHTIYEVGPNPFAKRAKWGVATTKGNRLFLHVNVWPKDGVLLIPRLHNSIKTAKLIGSDDELKVTPNVADWAIKLGEKPKRNLMPVVELTLNEPAKEAAEKPPLVQQSGDLIELHSRYSIVHGEMLRFEPQPHKNTVGYWVKEKDWAEWSCQPTKSGQYQVGLRYGCGNGQGGSEIEITIGDKKIPFKVEATGGFQTWRDVKLGAVELEAGKPCNVTVKVVSKAKNAVMDIQQITLSAQ